ncbi:MAG: diguanylate cyclase [Oleispira sp.]|nr:diguanylate cyclase [Oleispira sp.]MBL4882321.1 diguanylate cyclase [Oleispira sp.]
MSLNKGRILIADDEMVNIKVLVATLSDYETVIAKTGEHAVIKAQASQPPDLILLDINMPGMDGYEVCRILKNNPASCSIPIIFITVQASVEDETKGLEMGAVDYISKPFSPGIVRARVANHIELKQQRDLLEKLNVTDPLTKIANRRRMDDYLMTSFAQAKRSKSDMSLLMVDIDNFKPLNDLAGHGYGDECLYQVAQAIEQSLSRPNDLAARFGGEEFCVILPATELKCAREIAEEVRKNIESLQLHHPDENIERVTVSIGCSAIDDSMSEAIALFKQADEKLYEAKEIGRNCVV